MSAPAPFRLDSPTPPRPPAPPLHPHPPAGPQIIPLPPHRRRAATAKLVDEMAALRLRPAVHPDPQGSAASAAASPIFRLSPPAGQRDLGSLVQVQRAFEQLPPADRTRYPSSCPHDKQALVLHHQLSCGLRPELVPDPGAFFPETAAFRALRERVAAEIAARKARAAAARTERMSTK